MNFREFFAELLWSVLTKFPRMIYVICESYKQPCMNTYVKITLSFFNIISAVTLCLSMLVVRLIIELLVS